LFVVWIYTVTHCPVEIVYIYLYQGLRHSFGVGEAFAFALLLSGDY